MAFQIVGNSCSSAEPATFPVWQVRAVEFCRGRVEGHCIMAGLVFLLFLRRKSGVCWSQSPLLGKKCLPIWVLWCRYPWPSCYDSPQCHAVHVYGPLFKRVWSQVSTLNTQKINSRTNVLSASPKYPIHPTTRHEESLLCTIPRH